MKYENMKMKYKAKLRKCFFLNGYNIIYDNFGGIRGPLKQNLALQLCRIQNKDVSILTEADINLDQIHLIRNN